jgi:hypothetical protein
MFQTLEYLQCVIRISSGNIRHTDSCWNFVLISKRTLHVSNAKWPSSGASILKSSLYCNFSSSVALQRRLVIRCVLRLTTTVLPSKRVVEIWTQAGRNHVTKESKETVRWFSVIGCFRRSVHTLPQVSLCDIKTANEWTLLTALEQWFSALYIFLSRDYFVWRNPHSHHSKHSSSYSKRCLWKVMYPFILY